MTQTTTTYGYMKTLSSKQEILKRLYDAQVINWDELMTLLDVNSLSPGFTYTPTWATCPPFEVTWPTHDTHNNTGNEGK